MSDPEKSESESGEKQTKLSKVRHSLGEYRSRAMDIIRIEFLKATKSKSVPEGKRKAGEIVVQETAQFILSNIGDRVEIILYALCCMKSRFCGAYKANNKVLL